MFGSSRRWRRIDLDPNLHSLMSVNTENLPQSFSDRDRHTTRPRAEPKIPQLLCIRTMGLCLPHEYYNPNIILSFE